MAVAALIPVREVPGRAPAGQRRRQDGWRLPANLAANYAGRGWSILALWIFTPFYLRHLGPDAFGLIGFYTAVQSFMTIADAGLSPAMNREMARLSVESEPGADLRSTLRTLEAALLGSVLVLGLILVAGAGTVAGSFGSRGRLPLATVVSAVRLMGIAAVLQVFFGLHIGALLGLQRHVALNAILIACGTIRGIGSVALLSVSPTIQTFFLSQIGANAIQAAVLAAAVWKSIPTGRSRPRCDWSVFRRVLPYAAGVAGIGITSTLLMQADKFAIARLLDFRSLGTYTLAFTVGLAPVALAGPIATTFQPRFAQFVALGDGVGLSKLYHRAAQLVSMAVFPLAAVLLVFGPGLVSLWLADRAIAGQVSTLTPLLVAGSTMLAISSVPYALELAYGWTRLPLAFNCVATLVFVPVLLILIRRYGVEGAARAFLGLSVSYVAVHVPLMHRRLLRREMWRWYGFDLALPCAAVALAALAAKQWLPEPATRVRLLASAAALWLAALAAGVFCGSQTRGMAARAGALIWSFRRGSIR